MKKIEYFKRYLFLCIGMFIMSLGVAFSIKADLGTSPISSVPYVVSLISPMTVGMATIIMHCVFILLPIAGVAGLGHQILTVCDRAMKDR